MKQKSVNSWVQNANNLLLWRWVDVILQVWQSFKWIQILSSLSYLSPKD